MLLVMSAPSLLLHLHIDGDANIWTRRLGGALGAAAAGFQPNGRVYLLCGGPWTETPLSSASASTLSLIFDCVPPTAPLLDLVPLLPTAGWDAAAVGAIEDVLAVLVPADVSGEETETLAQVASARLASGLGELEHTPAAPLGPPVATVERDDAGNSPGELLHPCVAVGGTFDRMHAGHRLLLAVSALVCSKTAFVGITGDLLLASKHNAHLIWPFERREATAANYMRAVRPSLEVRAGALGEN